MSIFSKLWFWFVVLILFLVLILHDSDLDKGVQSQYFKQKMKLTEVHFSEIDKGFVKARIFCDAVDMEDDSQNNMIATNVRGLFYDKKVATKTAQLVSKSASRNPQEILFWGDVKIHTSENERLRTDELRYFVSRKEMYSDRPVTVWRENMVVTGKEFRYNSETKEGSLASNVVIRLYEQASLPVFVPHLVTDHLKLRMESIEAVASPTIAPPPDILSTGTPAASPGVQIALGSATNPLQGISGSASAPQGTTAGPQTSPPSATASPSSPPGTITAAVPAQTPSPSPGSASSPTIPLETGSKTASPAILPTTGPASPAPATGAVVVAAGIASGSSQPALSPAMIQGLQGLKKCLAQARKHDTMKRGPYGPLKDRWTARSPVLSRTMIKDPQLFKTYVEPVFHSQRRQNGFFALLAPSSPASSPRQEP